MPEKKKRSNRRAKRVEEREKEILKEKIEEKIKEDKQKENKKVSKSISKKSKKNNKKEKKHKGIKRFFLFILIIFAIIAAILGIQIYKNGGGMKGIVTTFVGSSADEIKNLDDIYVLCMGKSQNMTDTIMVAKYSPKNQQVSLLSIPRDSFVGKSKDNASTFDKINAKYQVNPQSTLDAVNDLTGLNVKYYVTVDTKALRDLVDALGGIEFDVPMDMDYDDSSQDLAIHLKKGVQVLNGMQAEGVVRFRHNNDGSSFPTEYGDNDIGRMRTQRAFIETVLKQTLKASNITKVNQLLNIAKEEVETNLSWDIIKNYIIAILDFDTANLKTDSLPGTPQYFNELSFFVVNKTEAKKKVEEMFLNEPKNEENEGENVVNETNTTTSKSSKSSTYSRNSNIKIEIINGTGSNSKFTSAQEQLKDRGYKISKKGTTNVTKKTIIINRKNSASEIENEIKSLLCTGAITVGEDNNEVDFTIIIGTDY